MNTSAIHQAILLNKYPLEMEKLTSLDADFPEGITDLLRLCASTQKLCSFSKKYDINVKTLRGILLNFIDKIILSDVNKGKRLLGLDAWEDTSKNNEILKRHYQLLIKIYHPDTNTSEHANDQTIRINEAYKSLKVTSSNFAADYKNITLSSVPPKSFYNASKTVEHQISSFKTAFTILTGLALISVAIFASYLLDPSKPEIITQTVSVGSTQQIPTTANTSTIKNVFSKARLDTNAHSAITDDANLQIELRNLEEYYEDGNVKRIKQILANSPETENQTDEQIQAKLVTLFKITQERKMLLYDFEWLNISGKTYGTGKFLSRYQMIGENSWVTRKGNAEVTVKELNKKLSITSFSLENNPID